MPREGDKRLTVAVEALKLLSENGSSFLSTSTIFEKLRERGVLRGESLSAQRKRLNRALAELEEAGYVESLYPEGKGRRGQKWRLNLKALPHFISLSEEELISLFTLTSFVPKKYRELEVLRPALKAVNRLGKLLDDDKKEVAASSFDYLPVPIERYTRIEPQVLKLIFQGIVERRELLINYLGKQFTVYPIKVFHYNGVFYLSTYLPEKREYRHLQIVKTKVYGLGKEYPAFYWKRYRNRFFSFREEPFVMRLELPPDYMAGHRPEYSVLHYPTQFHMEWDSEKVVVWLVAFNSYRFASWIILDELKAIYPPTKEDIEIAREKGLKEVYEGLTYDLRKNRKRFKEFKEEVRRFFERRKAFYESLL